MNIAKRAQQSWFQKGGVKMALAVATLLCAGCFKSPEAKEREIIETLTPATVDVLNKQKQTIFNQFHPVGQATGVELHEFRLSGWRNGERTGNFDDVTSYDFVFTLYWESPLVTGGYTRIQTRFDRASRRYTQTHVLETNGLTNRDANQMVDMLGSMLGR